jgi:hypothetical protein
MPRRRGVFRGAGFATARAVFPVFQTLQPRRPMIASNVIPDRILHTA